jgi:hypothetical protein
VWACKGHGISEKYLQSIGQESRKEEIISDIGLDAILKLEWVQNMRCGPD